jgi:hypothetical protein
VAEAGRRRAQQIAGLGGVTVRCGDGGVVQIDGLPDLTLFLRVILQGDTLVVSDTLLMPTKRLRAKSVRAVNLGFLEDLINQPVIAEPIRSRIERKGVNLRKGIQDFRGSDAISGADQPDERIHIYERRPLSKPSRGEVDGRFLRSVAAAYQAAYSNSTPPGPTIAREADVAVTAAHAWIRRSRRAGYLAPGEPGRTRSSAHIRIVYAGDDPFGEIPPFAWGEETRRLAKGEPAVLPLDMALKLLEDEDNWQPVPRNTSP